MNGLTTDSVAHTFDRPPRAARSSICSPVTGFQLGELPPDQHRSPLLKRGLGMHGLRAARRWRARKGATGRVRHASATAKSLLQFTETRIPWACSTTPAMSIRSTGFWRRCRGTIPGREHRRSGLPCVFGGEPPDIRDGEAFARASSMRCCEARAGRTVAHLRMRRARWLLRPRRTSADGRAGRGAGAPEGRRGWAYDRLSVFACAR